MGLAQAPAGVQETCVEIVDLFEFMLRGIRLKPTDASGVLRKIGLRTSVFGVPTDLVSPNASKVVHVHAKSFEQAPNIRERPFQDRPYKYCLVLIFDIWTDPFCSLSCDNFCIAH